jgi:hypothetical protein
VVIISLILSTLLATPLSIPSSYMTLEELTTSLEKAGISVEVSDAAKSRVYGVNLVGAKTDSVLGALKGDEALTVRLDGKKWKIDAKAETEEIYKQERKRFISWLRPNIQLVYGSASKQVNSIYAAPKAKFDAYIKDLESKDPKTMPPDMQLVYQHFITHQLSYAQIQLPLLAMSYLSADVVGKSTSSPLTKNVAYIAPMAETPDHRSSYPYMPEFWQSTVVGALIGPNDEPIQKKIERLRDMNCRMEVRWEPEDTRVSYSFYVDIPLNNPEGKSYLKRYEVRVATGSVGVNREFKPLPIEDVLLPDHLKKLTSRIEVAKDLFKNDPRFTHKATWRQKPALVSDHLLDYAKQNGVNVVFPISAFYNVSVLAEQDDTLAALLYRAYSPANVDRDAGANSLYRLEEARAPYWSKPLLSPEWIAWTSDNVVSLSHHLGCMEPLAWSPVFDIKLANDRLSGKKISVLNLLDAIATHKNWAKLSSQLPSNEMLSWGQTIGLLPFARLAQNSPAFRKAFRDTGSEPSTFKALTSEDIKTLASALMEIDRICPVNSETVEPRWGALDLMNNPPSSFYVSYWKSSNITIFHLFFDTEVIWSAYIRTL